jgi:hypothetical protein
VEQIDIQIVGDDKKRHLRPDRPAREEGNRAQAERSFGAINEPADDQCQDEALKDIIPEEIEPEAGPQHLLAVIVGPQALGEHKEHRRARDGTETTSLR